MQKKVTKREKEKLVDEMIFLMLCFDESTSPKPGAYLKRFMKNDRNKEIIQSLTTEDFNHRVEWFKGTNGTIFKST